MEEKKENSLKLKYLFLLLAAVFVLWFIIGRAMISAYPEKEYGTFGAVNSLFSGLAFVGIIYTILQQKEELRFQREELQLTRKELELTRQEFIDQNETFRLQRFENSYFQLLKNNSDLLDGQIKMVGKTTFKAIELINGFANDVKGEVWDRAKLESGSPDGTPAERIARSINEDEALKIIKTVYDNHKDELNQSLIHFYNSLFVIINFIDTTDLIEDKDRSIYVDILKAQMIENAKSLLFILLEGNEDMNEQKRVFYKYDFLADHVNTFSHDVFKRYYNTAR